MFLWVFAKHAPISENGSIGPKELIELAAPTFRKRSQIW